MNKIRNLGILLLVLLLSVSIVMAHGEEAFTKAEKIMGSNVSCDQLAADQLDVIGDYYMEQMHPGEAHEIMDKIMGGEGSDSLRQMHINLARSFYCGENNAMNSGMMGMVRNNMMNYSNFQNRGGMMNMMEGSYGMMGSYGWFGMGLLWLLYIALATFVFGIVFWWTYKLVIGNKKRK